MKGIIAVIILFTVSCTRNIDPGQRPVTNYAARDISIDFSERMHICDIFRWLSENAQLQEYDCTVTVEGLSVTQLVFEFSEQNLSAYSVSFTDISSEFSGFIRKEYPDVMVKVSKPDIIVEYSICTKLDYGRLRSYEFGKIPISALSALKVKYAVPQSTEKTGPVRIRIGYMPNRISRSKLTAELRKLISDFENSSGISFSYEIR